MELVRFLFVLDAAFFGARNYPNSLARLFLIGWNVMTLASGWYVWSSGALTKVQ